MRDVPTLMIPVRLTQLVSYNLTSLDHYLKLQYFCTILMIFGYNNGMCVIVNLS